MAASVALDLEALIGTATAPGTLVADPFDARRYVHGAGATVVLSSFARPRPQLLLEGCAEPVSAMAQSRSGVHLAAGEEGLDADITVWSADQRTGEWSALYKFEEHDNSVHSLSFSHDERLLASVGGDNRIIFWDMATGMIVSQVDASGQSAAEKKFAFATSSRAGSTQQPGAKAGCCIEAVLFGGLTQDVSGAFTSSYMVASAGRGGHLKVWSLDPFTGSFSGTDIKLGAATRDFAFSPSCNVSHGGLPKMQSNDSGSRSVRPSPTRIDTWGSLRASNAASARFVACSSKSMPWNSAARCPLSCNTVEAANKNDPPPTAGSQIRRGRATFSDSSGSSVRRAVGIASSSGVNHTPSRLRCS